MLKTITIRDSTWEQLDANSWKILYRIGITPTSINENFILHTLRKIYMMGMLKWLPNALNCVSRLRVWKRRQIQIHSMHGNFPHAMRLATPGPFHPIWYIHFAERENNGTLIIKMVDMIDQLWLDSTDYMRTLVVRFETCTLLTFAPEAL